MSLDLSALVREAHEKNDYDALVRAIPYARLLGIECLRLGDDMVFRLPSQPEGDVRLDILPEDPGSKPEVEISWLLPEQELPEARRLSKGYTLHLDLKRTGPNTLAGGFHLVLPPQLRTTLSGDLEL
ncbi:hypothetical protein, partial [Acinetobacter guerrae]|uniref:hypothetical protein n=1 Tax=Acinetobacter guerrae TaxID=1843371 RepID=UPI0021CCB041